MTAERSFPSRWRLLGMVAAALPLLALLGLMGWGLARSGGNPGGLLINSVFGEIKVTQGPAPPLSLPLLTGGTLDLASLRGKVVMVDFWSSWCPPCIEEAPVLSAVYPEYAAKGVEFVGVAIWDDEREVRRFVQRFRITYPVVTDSKGKVAIDYAVRGIPEKYFIDREGRLVRKFVGPVTAEKLKAILDGLLIQGGK